ncbi:uncharacterized protein [Euphorbia lathyris]|uniref:uncharacterized protein n=1 Tax=Euphorbia lathyris TaxID=212925 RepID=UPI0033131A79
MDVAGASESIICRLFSTTLGGAASDWFRSLPTESIHNWAQYSRDFYAKFVGCKAADVTDRQLKEIKQRNYTSLREFVVAFNDILVRLQNPDIVSIRNIMADGTTDWSMREEIIRNKPRTVAELMKIAKEFMEVDDVNREHRAQTRRERDAARSTSDNRRHQNQTQSKGNFVRKSDRSFQGGGYQTPLNTTRHEVLLWIEKNPLKKDVQFPKAKGRTSLGRYPNKYCRFHRLNGHDMNDCYELKREIEKLIERGKLSQFVRKEATNDKTIVPHETEARPEKKQKKGVINVIAGGIYEPSTKRSRREQRKSNTNRGDALNYPFARIMEPHADALVITVAIEGWDIKRVLVDTGSSCNVVTRTAFNQLGIHDERVEHTFMDVIGFGGQSSQTSGQVVLETEMGDKNLKWRGDLEFAIVDLPLAYNIILGRPFLSETESLISMKHLTLHLPTHQGRVVVEGDQLTSQQAYTISLEKKPDEEDKVDEKLPAEALGETELFAISDDKKVRIAAELSEEMKKAITDVLIQCESAFAALDEVLKGISPEIATHRLNVDKSATSVRQKKRGHAPERQKAIEKAVADLLKSDAIPRGHLSRMASQCSIG